MTPIFDIKELIALMRAGTSEEAIPHLEYITQKLPTHVAAHALLAQAYTNEGRLGEAKLAWQNALFLMPNSPSVQKGFRRVLKELSRQQQNQNQPTPPDIITPPVEPAATENEPIQEPLSSNGQLMPPEEETPVDEETSVKEIPVLEDSDLVEQQPVDEISSEGANTHLAENLEEEVEAKAPDQQESDVLTASTVTEGLPAVENDESVTQATDVASALDDYVEGADQAPPNSEEAPSMLVNPSSHHNVVPVEIETVSPQDLGSLASEEQEEGSEPSGTDDIALPVITVPTQNSTPSRPPAPTRPHVPPILAPLLKDSDEWVEDQELDHLIEELESARIIPKPDHEHIEAPVLEDNVDDMVSETLARIFEGQNQYGKAADMYDKLATIHPERSKKFKEKAASLRDLLSSNSDEVHDTNSGES